MNKYMILLLFIIAFINIIEGYQCRLYLWANSYFRGTEDGPYDVGDHSFGGAPNIVKSVRLYAQGYTCHSRLYSQYTCTGSSTQDLTVGPFQLTSVDVVLLPSTYCFQVWSVATPKPTLHPSAPPSTAPTAPPSTAPSAAPTTAPTSSCLDYNNETSFDGNNEIREFNYKNIININNYHINKNIILEFNTSH
eukprot:19734_1